MALVVLEPIRSEDEVIIEARKEERHEHIRSRKLAIFEYAHLHQGPLRRLGFEVVLPEAECDDDNEGNDDETGTHGVRQPTTLPSERAKTSMTSQMVMSEPPSQSTVLRMTGCCSSLSAGGIGMTK